MRMIWTDDAGVAAARAACVKTVVARRMPREKDVAVVAVTCDEAMGADDFEAFSEAMRLVYPKGLLVGLGGPGAGIQELDEAEMNVEGWFRQPKRDRVLVTFGNKAGLVLEREVHAARIQGTLLWVTDYPEARVQTIMARMQMGPAGYVWKIERMWAGTEDPAAVLKAEFDFVTVR